jgi:hypothetical protein
MSSNASSTPTPVTDEQLVVDLTSVLERARAGAKAELAELEPKREQLSARIATLEHTIAVYKGETPARPVRRRAASNAPPARARPRRRDARELVENPCKQAMTHRGPARAGPLASQEPTHDRAQATRAGDLLPPRLSPQRPQRRGARAAHARRAALAR